MDQDVVHRHRGQPAVELDPALAAFERHEDAALGAGEQQARIARILAHHLDRDAGGQVAGDGFPALPAVVGGEQVGMEIVGAVSVHGEVGGAGVVVRRLDAAHVEATRHAAQVRGEVGPVLAGVASGP